MLSYLKILIHICSLNNWYKLDSCVYIIRTGRSVPFLSANELDIIKKRFCSMRISHWITFAFVDKS